MFSVWFIKSQEVISMRLSICYVIKRKAGSKSESIFSPRIPAMVNPLGTTLLLVRCRKWWQPAHNNINCNNINNNINCNSINNNNIINNIINNSNNNIIINSINNICTSNNMRIKNSKNKTYKGIIKTIY